MCVTKVFSDIASWTKATLTCGTSQTLLASGSLELSRSLFAGSLYNSVPLMSFISITMPSTRVPQAYCEKVVVWEKVCQKGR